MKSPMDRSKKVMLENFWQTKNFWEIVGHNGPIYKTQLSNIYFMATVQHLKNCVQGRRKV